MKKRWKNIKKRKGGAKWFLNSSGKSVELFSCGHGGWWRLRFILLFLALKGLGWNWGSMRILPTGSPSAPVTILWLPRASLNCGSCRESIAWTWGSHGWPPGRSLHSHRRWLLPRCFGGASMSVWLRWWIAVGSNRNPFQEDRGLFPGSLAMTGKENESTLDLTLSPQLSSPSNFFSNL